MKKWSVVAVAAVVAVVAALNATAAAQSPRFSDVPLDHYAFEAVEWAAEAGVTAGYDDGTFKPQRSLIKRHAVVFMERYYEEILQAEESEDFTRGDMMVLLKAINDGTLRGKESANIDLAGVCPSPLVVQTDWFPESDVGALYHLIGEDYTVDTANRTVRGSMTLDGIDLGVEFEIRSGGPAIGFASVSSHMHTDSSVHLGLAATDRQVLSWADAPVVSVVTLLEKSPWMIMWDPQAYPDIDSIADLGSRGVRVNVFAGDAFPSVLAAQGVWSLNQVEASYDGSPAQFVAEGGEIAQQGLATLEVYNYEHVHLQWGRPVAFQLLHDAGFPNYSHSLAVRPRDLVSMKPCLEALVPVIQRAVVSFAAAPDRATATVVDAADKFGDFWLYSAELAAFAARAQVEYGLVGNGPDSTTGNLDAERIQRVLDGLSLAGLIGSSPSDPSARDLFTNEFIDESIGF